ncbi:MAG: LPS export ABC transporter periplasmic protein LptC, partial [Bacteroidetes bacterium]|nr:LPS export ABC transporter periplasmic protein LptC [Bacteroidota bacterium]
RTSNRRMSKYFQLIRNSIFSIRHSIFKKKTKPTLHYHRQRRWFSKLNKIHHSALGAHCSLLITLSFLLLALSFLSCEEKIKPAVTNTNYGQNVPVQESWNSRITFTQEGRLVAVVKSGHIAVYEDKRETILSEGVRVEFYNDTGERTSVLTSEKGKVFDATRDLEATENVVIVSDSSQTTLRTQKLSWTNSTKKIHSNEYVEIDAPNEKIRGLGFESDQNLQNYKIFRVTGQVENIK